MKTHYDAVIQKNGRGGFEIAMPGEAPGRGMGNYPTAGDAYAVAKYNFENVKAFVEEKAKIRPASARPSRPVGMAKARAAR